MEETKETSDPITKYENDGVVTIGFPERFSFDSHDEFRKLYCDYEKGTKYQLNFGKVKYIDSSALGMLLLLMEHNGKCKQDISIMGCTETVENIFKVANFDRLFEIL